MQWNKEAQRVKISKEAIERKYASFEKPRKIIAHESIQNYLVRGGKIHIITSR